MAGAYRNIAAGLIDPIALDAFHDELVRRLSADVVAPAAPAEGEA